MNKIECLYKKADAQIQEGHFGDAAKYYRQIAEMPFLNKERVVFYLLASDAYLDAGNFTEAIDDCRSAIALDSGSSVAWRGLGYLLITTGRIEEAEHALLTSIGISASATACIYLAAIYFENDRFEDAERFCCKALQLDPSFDEAHYNLGLALKGQGLFYDAIQAYRSAVRISPDYSLAHRELGKLFLEMGDRHSALQHLRKSHELTPDDSQVSKLLDGLEEGHGSKEA